MHGHLLNKRIRMLLDLDLQVRIHHVYYEANRVADGLANLAMVRLGIVFFTSTPQLPLGIC